MISTMRERLSAKLGNNNNNNAFKMRKLFKMYDKKEVGMVSSAPGSCRSASCQEYGSVCSMHQPAQLLHMMTSSQAKA
jgi:hypothetical protein